MMENTYVLLDVLVCSIAVCFYSLFVFCLVLRARQNTNLLLTEREGRTGVWGILAQDRGSTDWAQRGPCKNDRGPIFSSYYPSLVGLYGRILTSVVCTDLSHRVRSVFTISVKIKEFKQTTTRRRQRERHQTKGLMGKTIAVHMCY